MKAINDKALRARLKLLARQQRIYDFRPGQEETMINVLRGEDTLAIMPTGAGKSLCYQLPAQLNGGTTIVVSPLISLMKDQHQKLSDMGVISQHLSSDLTRKQAAAAIERLGNGDTSIQFVTPEKLENAEVLKAFRQARVSLFVVDEAHCISEWGHDFRPAYLGLSKAIEALGHPPVLALTATATPEVTRDIQHKLGFKGNSHVVRISYRRDNLLLRAREFKTEQQKYVSMVRVLTTLKGHSGIIYCASVKQTEALTRSLRLAGFTVAQYHGRMKKKDRRQAQERFMRRPGVVMVATSAFGMGIDKPDVRFVINYQIPSSIESYYQEVGRAGRDGKKAYGVMYYTRRDKSLQRVLQLRKYPNLEFARRTNEAVFSRGGEPISQLEVQAQVGKKKLGIVLQMMERLGFVRAEGRQIIPIQKPTAAELAAMVAEWENRKLEDTGRLEEIIRYVHTNLCRWYYLLRYFGEELEEPCGICDNCRRQAETHPTQQGEMVISKGAYVRHDAWGVGEVMAKIGPNLRIFFPGVGEKVLREGFVRPWIHGEPAVAKKAA